MDFDYKNAQGEALAFYDEPLTCDEIDRIKEEEAGYVNGVFCVPLRPLMDQGSMGEATDWMMDYVLGGYPGELDDWDFAVVGCQPPDILHLHIFGYIVEE